MPKIKSSRGREAMVMVELSPEVRNRLDELKVMASEEAPVTLRQLITRLILDAHHREISRRKKI